jgi:uncharacterized membrane protein
MHYFPLAWPFFLLLALLFFFLVAFVEIGVLRYAYEQMGVPRRYVLLVLLLSLLGSSINIPVAQLQPERMVTERYVDFFGVRWVIPVVQAWPGTIIALNLGGAVIPTILSLYLMVKNNLYVRGTLAVAAVAVVTHWLAQPVRGVGISVPTLAPPVVAAAVAIVLGWRRAAPLAYIAGSLGTLIGADLLNLDKVQGLGAPVASIGGAGTFDGIFVSGILAVLLSSIFGGPRQSSVSPDTHFSVQ